MRIDFNLFTSLYKKLGYIFLKTFEDKLRSENSLSQTHHWSSVPIHLKEISMCNIDIHP